MLAVGDHEVARRSRPSASTRWRLGIAGGLVALFLVLALLPGVIVAFSPADHDPQACSIRGPDGEFRDRLPPSRDHWFGTDVQGCDYFSRVVYGARVSLAVALGAVIVDVVLGMLLGGIAGYAGGRWDRGISRAADLFVGLPQVITVILVLALLAGDERTIPEVAIALGLLGWPFSARIFRARVLAVRRRPFVDAATVAGVSPVRILLTHVVPNAAGPLVVHGTVVFGLIIGVEAALAYLGVGLAAPTISWGLMIEPAQARLGESPHLMFFPCLFIALAVLAFLLLGDSLQDALDPREEA